MRGTLFKLWEGVRASYWFVPSVMTIGAAVLALALVEVDGRMAGRWPERLAWIYAVRPEGAQAMLATISGSMITVAGVTFSITIAAVAYAASQFGPRLLSNFLRDRGNQFTLGTFIATFVYCLLVLRSVRSAEAPQAGGAAEAAAAFVPHLALLAALALSVASIGVFIYFIHHVPEQIHIGRVVARIGGDLIGGLEALFPEHAGEEAQAVRPEEAVRMEGEARPVPSHDYGYVQFVDVEALLEAAVEHDAVLFVRMVPGDFAHNSLPLVGIWPPEHCTDELARAVRRAFTLGAVRTPVQDARFLVDELAEISARALSAAINDPYTAMNCAEWLTSAVIAMARRPVPQPYRFDGEQRLRLVAEAVDFATLLRRAFDGTRQYVSADRNAALHQMTCFARVAEVITRPEEGQMLAALSRRFHAEAREHLVAEADRRDLDERLAVVVQKVGEVGG